MTYYCLRENEDGVPCGRKIEGKFNEWVAVHIGVCRECLEEMQRIDEMDDRYDCPIHGLQDTSDCPRC